MTPKIGGRRGYRLAARCSEQFPVSLFKAIELLNERIPPEEAMDIDHLSSCIVPSHDVADSNEIRAVEQNLAFFRRCVAIRQPDEIGQPETQGRGEKFSVLKKHPLPIGP